VVQAPAPIYLDHAATTPLCAAARDALQACLAAPLGNPSSPHGPGQAAAEWIDAAARRLAGVIGAQPEEIVWTSGATEATNLALRGVAEFAARGHKGAARPAHIISCETEHSATRDTLKALAERGTRITWLGVDEQGRIDLAELDAALDEASDLVSLMHVNNETGLIHDIPAVAEICQRRGVPLHVDACQSLTRLPIDVAATPIALMSMSAHKIGGPPGVGALYVRRRPRVGLAPQIIGGGQQKGRRAGTLATHQIAAFGVAAETAAAERETQQARYRGLSERLWQGLSAIDGVTANHAAGEDRAAPFVNVSVAGVHGEALRAGLAYGAPNIALSGGSACSAARGASSYVLRAMGRTPAAAAASLRLTLGPEIDEAIIDTTIARIAAEITRLRRIAGQA
tara:strand:+ start:2060 stop:3256 length:1197 start_codon:yes stop_codon:yes gene_type:complete